MNKKSNYKRGFTLIEILGVLVVLSILALIAIPQVGRMISSARVEAAKSSVRNYVVGANAQASMSLVSKDGIDVTNTKFVFETGVDDAELSKIEINGDVPSYAYLKYDVVAKSVAYGIFCSKGYSFEYDNGIIKETEENYCNQTYDKNNITITEIVSGTNSIKVKYTVADPSLVTDTKCYYSQNKTYALEGAVYNNECNIEGLKHNTTYQFKICITDTENKEECEASYVTTLKMSNPTITYLNTPNIPVNGYLKSQTLKVKYYSEFIENPQYFVRSPKTSTISTSTIQSCGTGELPGTCITDVVTTLEAGKWYKVPDDVDITFTGNSTESGYLMAATYDGFNYAAAARAIVSKTDNENPIIEIGYPSKTTNTLKVPFNVSDSKSGIATYTCKYSDVSGSYSIDGSIQNMICTLSNLQSNKTYYYQICATDKLGNSDCKTGSAKTVNIVNPTITVTSTPEIPVNGYYRSQDFTVIYSRQNMTNPTFYVRATRTAATLPLMILERCNSGGTLNINSCSTINTTTVTSGYWYKVKETFRLIYNAYANSEASIKAVTYDGNNLSGAATIPVAKIDTKAPTVTLGTVTQTTNSVVINYTLTDNESGIDTYTCRYSDTLNKYTTNGSSITDTSCTLTNLKNNTTYYYQICATDKLGNTSNDSCVTDSIKTDNIVTPTISITNTPTVSQNDYLTKQEVTITYNGTGTTDPLYYFKTTRNAKLKTGTIQKACGTETVPGECVNTNNDIAADTWYKVAGNVTLTYDESADVEASLIAVTYDGTNYSNSVSVVLSKIDLEKPVINIINAVPTSNSIELTYEISDAKSGIDTYTCEYSTAYNGTYSPITNATLYGCKLTSSLAKNTTYYYRICATDKLGFSECAVGSRVTLDVNKPTISYTNTPNEPGNGYLKNQVATINYVGGTDFQYFVKTTRKASIPSTTVKSCGTGGGPSRCGSESTVTELSANTWYKVPNNISLTYNETNSTDAYIYAINTDSRNESDMLTGMVAKIDTLDPTITNFTATSTTNSLTINYTLNDANSGIAYYTCKYGTSNNNYANTVEATNSSCVLNNLDNANTYYYQICVYDNVGNYTCDTGNKKPNIVNSPVFVFTNDPISPVADYLKSQKVEIKFDATNINNPEYYIKSTKNGVSNIATSYVCGSDTTQSNCVTSNNTNIEAGKWYRVSGDIEITYTDTNTNNNNIYAVTYDGNNYSTSASTSLSKIDVTNPTINITSTTSNSTSITINYTLTDNESGINTTECKYSDTVNSYINDGTASNNRCVIAGLDSSKTYYYEICTYDKVNNKTCVQDSYTAKSIINPIITFTNTPSEAANNYFKEQVANIAFSNEGVADATYYIKTTRKGNVSSMTANTCGTGTLPGSCSSNTNVTELTANTWYKVPGNTNVTYNETNTSEAYIYAVTYDGNKYSGTVTSVIAKIDRNLPVVTIDSTLSTTNSITINYTLSDTHSGIDTYTCKYGEVSGTYNKDATNVTASTCEIKNLTKGKTYYYQVCAVDRVGNNAACEIGSIVTNTPNTPVCTPYNTPTNSVDGYLKSQKMTCTFNTANITNPTYYIKTMRDARSLTNVLATCGTDTTPGTCSNASTKSLSANTWYKVAGEIDVIYDETNTSESIIYAMIYDETNYTSSTTNVAKIDTTEPLLGLSTPIITTNSIEIPLTMSDAHSGIASYTCKYSDTANTYTNDAFSITESKCMLNWLTSGKTYYYKICVIDKVGTETCKTGAANTRTIVKPTISITNTPSDTPNNDTDNYVRNSVASITYSNSGTTTVDYYVKSTRDAKLNVSTTSSCGTETMPGACIADTTTNIVANTWYRVPSNVSITYDVTDTSTATLYATAHDGDNFIPDSTVSVIIPKVDKASPELTIDKTTINTSTNSAIITYSISDTHSGIDSYTCKYSTTNSNYQYDASIMTVTNNTCTISNLEDDKTYYYQVCATDKVGNDTTCDTGTFKTSKFTKPTVSYTNTPDIDPLNNASTNHYLKSQVASVTFNTANITNPRYFIKSSRPTDYNASVAAGKVIKSCGTNNTPNVSNCTNSSVTDLTQNTWYEVTGNLDITYNKTYHDSTQTKDNSDIYIYIYDGTNFSNDGYATSKVADIDANNVTVVIDKNNVTRYTNKLVIPFTITDEHSGVDTSKVTCKYSTTSGTYNSDNKISINNNYNECTISGINDNTTYYYQICGTDLVNNTTVCKTGDTTTAKFVNPVISYTNKPNIQNIGQNTNFNGTYVEAKVGETHQGIIYMDPTNLSTVCTADDSKITSTSSCKKFYIFGETTDGKFKLIMDRNLGDNIEWINLDDYLTAGGTAADYGTDGKNDKGAITANNAVTSRTTGWIGNPRLITGAEIRKITGNSSSSSYYFGSLNTTTYANQTEIEKARQKTFHWLFDYSNQSRTYGGKVNDSSNNGYWTSSKVGGSNYTTKAWYVSRVGGLRATEVSTTTLGVRPVIEIPKETINTNNYLREQIVNIEFTSTDIENPRYFVKSARPVTTNALTTGGNITSGTLLAKCGNDTVPETCSNTSDTVLDQNYWYEVDGNISITYDKTYTNESFIYAYIYDGTNYSADGYAAGNIARIDSTPVTVTLTEANKSSKTNSITIPYSITDIHSGVTEVTCKYSETNSDYTYNPNNTTITNSSCTIEGLQNNKTYYYEICANDRVNNGSVCARSSYGTKNFSNPEVQTPTFTPSSAPHNGYYKTYTAKILFNSTNVDNPRYFIKSNRDIDSLSNSTIKKSCTNDTNGNPTTCTNYNGTVLNANTWYEVSINPNMTFTTTADSENSLYALMYDGNNYSASSTYVVPMIDNTSVKNFALTSHTTTNNIVISYTLDDENRSGVDTTSITCKYGTTSGNYNNTVSSSNVTSTSCTISGINNKTKYYFQVCVKDNAGNNETCVNNEDTTKDFINPTISFSGKPGITYVAPQSGETHKGIVYMDPSNIDTYCDASSTINSNTTGCKKFYIYDDEDTNVYKLIMDRNLGTNVAWVSQEDYVNAGGTAAEYGADGNNSKGPITANKNIAGRAVNWIGNPRMITALEIAHIVGADREDTIKWDLNKSFAWTPSSVDSQSSWFYLDGAGNNYSTSNGWHYQQSNSTTKSLYAWLYDYTNGCVDYGCYNNLSSSGGYFSSNEVATTYYVWYIARTGYLTAIESSKNYGIRPVIELPKTIIDNVKNATYLKEQTAIVTFNTTNINTASARYFIRSSRDTSSNAVIASGVVKATCGTDTNPTLTCTANSDTTLVKNTWYEINASALTNNKINVVYNTTFANESFIYAYISDGTNIDSTSGYVAATVSKIDATGVNDYSLNTASNITTNSMTIGYTITDANSGLGNITCEFSETNDNYKYNPGKVTVTTSNCTLSNLKSNTTYYYQICASDAVGNTELCKTGSATTLGFTNPTISIINTPSTLQNEYTKQSVATVTFTDTNITSGNAEYYIKPSSAATLSVNTTLSCGTGTNPGYCSVITGTKNLSANTWYQVTGNSTVTFNQTNSNTSKLYASIGDGVNTSTPTDGGVTIPKIDGSEVNNFTPTIDTTQTKTDTLVINYNITDTHSGVDSSSITCGYSLTNGSFVTDAKVSNDTTNNKCTITTLANNTKYYIQICAADLVGNTSKCSVVDGTTADFVLPTYSNSFEPSTASDLGYYKSQIVNITYSDANITTGNASYYIKPTRGNIKLASGLVTQSCGTSTNPANCSDASLSVSSGLVTLTKNTWYKVENLTNNELVAYNRNRSLSQYRLLVKVSDGTNYSANVDTSGILLYKIDADSPNITNLTTTSTTNSIRIIYTLDDIYNGNTYSGVDTTRTECYYGTSDTDITNTNNITVTTTECNISNLVNNQTYYYKIIAYDKVGNSKTQTGTIKTKQFDNPEFAYVDTPNINKVDAVTGETHKGIVYLDPANPSTLCTASSTLTYANTGCKKFYIYDDSGDTYKMIMYRNTTNKFVWVSQQDYTNSGGTAEEYGSYGNSNRGPISAITQLNSDTANWIGNPRMITAEEIAHIVGADTSLGWSKTKTYKDSPTDTTKEYGPLYFDGSGNTYSGWQTQVASGEGASNYAWLFDYTSDCKTYGCSEEFSTASGYWTSSTLADTRYAWSIRKNGQMSITRVYSATTNGLRPVIELPKAIVDKTYLQSQAVNVTFVSDNVTNPKYFIKTGKEATVPSGVVSKSCGTDTLPTLNSCTNSSVTTMVANTWYEISGNTTVTYSTTSSETANLYASVYDGNNFSSAAASPVSKIDNTLPTLTKGTVTSTTNSITIPYTITENESGIAYITCKYGYTDGTYTNIIDNSNITNASCTIPRLIKDSTYYYQVIVTDKTGNNSTAITGNINTKPVTNPTVTYTNNIQVTKEIEANSTHKGIVYLNPKSPTTACTESSTLTNTNTGCKKFYIYDDSGDTYKMIMDRNMSGGTVAWINETDYTNAGGTSSDWTNKLYNKFGPITAVKTLYSNTSGWIGNPRLITADEVAHIVGADDADEAIGWSSTKTYKNSTSADPITEIYRYYLDGSGTTYSDSNGWNKKTATTAGSSNYGWLFDYTYQCTSNGCNIADDNTYNENNIRGYWTATANSNINGAWYVGNSGMAASITANTSNGAGIRPVIEIAKEVIDNSYLKSQVAKVTFTSTNITNPRYFIKTTKVSTVAANKVTYACGTETLPDITNCSSSSVTTLDTNTWYEVTSTLNVTYNTSNANTGNLYAVTYDGINFSGSVEVPIAKIDSVAPTITKSGSLSATTNSITRDYTITENESGIAYITCKYGYASGSYTNVVDSSNVTTTSCTIPNLKSNTRYYYQVIVTDKAGNDSTAITGYNTTKAITNPSVAYTNNPYIIKVNAASTDTHFGIIYMDPSNLTNECNSSSTLTITNTGCKKFYIYDESGDTYKMIMDRNLGDNVRWITKDDYLTAGGTEAEWGTGNTSKGPLTAMEQLNNDTTGWIGNPRMITADEIAAIVGADTAVNWSSSNPYGTDVNSQTSWIYLDGSGTTYSSEDGWQKQVATSAGKSSYAWLFDYTNGCRSYGCNTQISGVYGYWTSSKIVNSNNVWLLNRQGRFYNSNDVNGKITSNNYGVRPVITLPKDLVNGNYINNQTLTVTYDNTSMTNPRYFVKTTKDTSIASGQVIGSCGTNTLPNPNCNSASVTTLLSDTWYEVNNPANVTNSIIDDSYANLYAVTYDGTNFSGSVEVPMSKIDNTIPADFTITLSNRSTNSITLTYSLTDNDSGIFNEGTTCKYSDTLNSYIYDASTVTSSSCLIQGLIKDKTYYYQVCAYDKAGNKRCKTGSTETLTPVNPTISYTVNPLIPTFITPGDNDKHLGIIYMDPTNLNTVCNESMVNANVNANGTPTGKTSGCMKFYIFEDDGTNYKLILDHNTSGNVAWANQSDYLASGGTVANWDAKKYALMGPITAKKRLEEDTLGWIGNPRMITADEIAHIVKADLNTTLKWNSSKTYAATVSDMTTEITKYYLYGSGNSYSASDGWQKPSINSNYNWLVDYTNACISYSGCTHEDNNSYPYPTKTSSTTSGIAGYWTDTIINNSKFNNVWAVSYDSYVKAYYAYRDNFFGIRPVITIPQSLITGSYLNSQVSNITFSTTNISSPRYFVKSTSSASIPSGKVISACGTGTVPNLGSCTSSSVTTLEANTWYEVNGNVNVTHNVTNSNPAALYAITSDGVNFTGSISVPVGKIDATNPSTPTVTYTTGSNTSNWQNNVSITLSSTDNVAVWYYEADTNNDGNADFTINTVYEPKNVNYSTIRYRAVDTVGNRSDWTSNYTLKVDATTPTITINSSIPDFIKQGDSYQVLGTYTGGASVNTPTCNYSNTTSLQPGEYTLSCTVTSASGNSATATKKLLVIYPIYSARESNQTLFTINGRNYIKPNASHAIAGMFYIDSSNYLGPIMVSTDSAAVRYTTSGDSNTDNIYITTYSYKGITWYISANNAFVSNGSTNYHRRATDVTVPLIAATTFNEANTNATMQAAAKKLIDNALSGEYVEFGACTFTEQVFEYTGGAVNFTVPCEGTYILEVWGAQGGGQGSSGGKGGYSRGYQTLAEDQELTIVVGGAGTLTGGYNGGGNGTGTDYYGGGGATHIAKKNNSYTTLESYGNATTANNYLYIVAGGGGGAATYQSIPHSGAGGGDTIRPNQEWSGYSGFGKGANANYTQNDFGGAGGGGGYYGGRSDHNANAPGGGGGISYLDGVFNNYNEIGVRESNGKAKITFVPDFSPEDGINFSYTGTIQKYIIPETGMYYVEAWGAEGGNSEYAGGKGGYSYGYRHFDQGDVIYIGVGGKGTNNYSISDVPGGFNGGGTGKSAAAGGGATHMAFVDGTLNTIGYTSFVTNENGIIAAGGGGGSGRLRDWTGTEWVDSTYHLYPAYRDLYGGDGGGVNGSSGTGIYGNSTASALEIAVGHGGTPTSGGIGDRDNHATGDGSFGLGGTPSSAGAGGGGGLYGGGSGSAYNSKTPGGGGSGYFVALTSGNTETGVREGDGHAKITKVPEYEFESMDFLYSGLVQKFIIPKTGTYLLETWGGAGGKSSDGNISGGKGAYAYGFKSFTAGDVIYIAVGGKGNDSLNQSSVTIPGGFNGGGTGRTTSSSDYTGGGGGGGATHIGLSNALLKDTTVGNLLLVAGGGGGAALAAGGDGGNIGADVNVSGTGVSCTGGTKTSAGTSSLTGAAYTAASYGVGGSASGGSEMGGGGSGLYGGSYGRGGCGGSSYTASSLLNATIEDGINTLEGHAKITFITSDAISTNFYMATGNCTRGTYQRGTCHFDNNQTECGCSEYNECQDESCGLYCTSSSICGTGYPTCTNSTCCGNEIGTCATEACGCAARNSCANGSACGWTCDDYTWTRNGSKCTKTTSYSTTYSGTIVGCENNTFQDGQYSCNPGDRMWACNQNGTLGTTIWCEHITVKNAKAKSCVNDSCSCATYNTCQSADCPAGAAKTCSNACCGAVQAKTCRNDEACIGVEGAHYGTCQNSNCTCKTANSCNKSDLVYYTCPNGGTLRGSICITS